MKDTLGKKIESDMFNSYDVADALMELCGFDYNGETNGFDDTEYKDLYEELEGELYNLKAMAENKHERNGIRTLWNILGMIGELGTRTGNWHSTEDYDFDKYHLRFPSHEEY